MPSRSSFGRRVKVVSTRRRVGRL